jgi:hypothetical protein
MAKLHSDALVNGVDAHPESASGGAAGTPEGISWRPPQCALRPAYLEQAPGALATLADRLTVLLPLRSLLRAVARPDRGGLARLAALCRDGAEVCIVFGAKKLASSGKSRVFAAVLGRRLHP